MNDLERRYLGPTPYRTRKEKRDEALSKEQRLLLASGIFGIFAITFFANTVIEPLFLDPLIREAQAAERPVTEAEWTRYVCGDLGRYTNGVEFYEYCGL